MQAIDLHVHSTFSDGTLTPTELVDLAIKSNLEAFALTDHDTTDGIEEAYTASVGKDIEVIPGIEFSTEYKKKDIHILGYYINPYNEKNSEIQEKSAIRKCAKNYRDSESISITILLLRSFPTALLPEHTMPNI